MLTELDIGCAIFSGYDADGFPEVQHDALGEQDSGVAPYPAHHPHGFVGRPLDPVLDGNGDPDPRQSAQVLVIVQGGRGHAIVLEDVRVVPLLPALQKGESLQYGAAGQFLRCHADGSISLVTSDAGGAPSGQTIAWRMTPTGFDSWGPWGTQTFDASGFRINYVAGSAGGASFTLGYAGGVIPGLSTVARLQADMIEINGGAVSIGPTGAIGQPVAQALPLVAVLQGLVTANATLSAAISAWIAAWQAEGAVFSSAWAGAMAGPSSAVIAAIAAQTAASEAIVAAALTAISSQTAVG